MKRKTIFFLSAWLVLSFVCSGQTSAQDVGKFFQQVFYASKGAKDANDSVYPPDDHSAYLPPGEFVVLDIGQGRYFTDGPREDVVLFIRGSEHPRIIVEANDPTTKTWHELRRLMSPDPYGRDERGLALDGCEFYDMSAGLIGFSRFIRIRNVSMNSNVFVDAVWARYIQ